MEWIRGYKRLVCPNCEPGNKNSKVKANYKVFYTNANILLICRKCGSKMIIEKKNKGQQREVKIA